MKLIVILRLCSSMAGSKEHLLSFHIHLWSLVGIALCRCGKNYQRFGGIKSLMNREVCLKYTERAEKDSQKW